MEQKQSSAGKIVFGGFSLFFIGLTLLFYYLGFREVNIKKDLWTEVEVKISSYSVDQRKISGPIRFGRSKMARLISMQTEGSLGVNLPTHYFDYFDLEDFKKDVKRGDVLYMTVLKDEVGHMSAKLGGVRKGDKVYFDLDRMLQAENRSFLVSKIIFWILFAMTTFWLRLTYIIFTRKPKSLSESLTGKD